MIEINGLQLPDEAEYPRELTEQWELLECLSGNRETETLLARRRGTGEKAAVKYFPAVHPLYGHRIPETLKQLNAPPMPRCLGEYADERGRCVLWEYVEGETLAEAAGDRTFSREEITGIGIALCRQLEVLHQTVPPIIHRDVKPQNIILREDGTPVLIDFGIARVSAEKKADTVILGTEGFAPPEQYGFAGTDARSDIYSLGMVLNWMLNGGTVVPENPETPLEKVIRRMTAFDPERRYDSAGAAEKALEQSRPAARRKRMTAVFLAAVMLIFALTFGAVKLTEKKKVSFSHPLIAEAVRLNLGLPEGAAVTEDDLSRVKGVYIVADGAYADADGFYSAVSRWYAGGRKTRGGIISLNDLARMPAIEQVCIAAQELTDIGGLKNLTRLNKAEFKHNRIEDISALAGLKRLTSVGLNDNPVRDLSPLLELPDLAFLDLCEVRNYDPKTIAELGNLDYLDISNPTESYHYLGGKSIRSLAAAWTGMTSLEELKGVTGLDDLEIGHTGVTDLSPLAAHTGLRRVGLTAAPVRDLSPLLSLPNLESVTLSRDMEPLLSALGDVPFNVEYE